MRGHRQLSPHNMRGHRPQQHANQRTSSIAVEQDEAGAADNVRAHLHAIRRSGGRGGRRLSVNTASGWRPGRYGHGPARDIYTQWRGSELMCHSERAVGEGSRQGSSPPGSVEPAAALTHGGAVTSLPRSALGSLSSVVSPGISRAGGGTDSRRSCDESSEVGSLSSVVSPGISRAGGTDSRRSCDESSEVGSLCRRSSPPGSVEPAAALTHGGAVTSLPRSAVCRRSSPPGSVEPAALTHGGAVTSLPRSAVCRRSSPPGSVEPAAALTHGGAVTSLPRSAVCRRSSPPGSVEPAAALTHGGAVTSLPRSAVSVVGRLPRDQ